MTAIITRVRSIFLLSMMCACGARTELRDTHTVDGGTPLDATTHDVVVSDAKPPVDVIESDVVTACTQGILTQFPTSDCGGDQVDWFATPYTPTADITVDRVEAFMQQGNVALLASSGATPGAVLFVGSVGTSTQKTWLGANVNPPVFLQGGTLYYVGFQGDCSFAANGPEPVEYMASSVDGPWHDQGTDNWTARLIGMCP